MPLKPEASPCASIQFFSPRVWERSEDGAGILGGSRCRRRPGNPSAEFVRLAPEPPRWDAPDQRRRDLRDVVAWCQGAASRASRVTGATLVPHGWFRPMRTSPRPGRPVRRKIKDAARRRFALWRPVSRRPPSRVIASSYQPASDRPRWMKLRAHRPLPSSRAPRPPGAMTAEGRKSGAGTRRFSPGSGVIRQWGEAAPGSNLAAATPAAARAM